VKKQKKTHIKTNYAYASASNQSENAMGGGFQSKATWSHR
jgi:hypothetical protein